MAKAPTHDVALKNKAKLNCYNITEKSTSLTVFLLLEPQALKTS
jgi:hypothetical protein